MKVLLVDESRIMRKVQRHAIMQMEYTDSEILDAGNGIEALRKLKAYNYQLDFMLLDIQMAGDVSGLELIKTLRVNRKSRRVPIIICTDEQYKEEVLNAIEHGATDYILKPFQPTSLKEKINDVLETEEPSIENVKKLSKMGTVEWL